MPLKQIRLDAEVVRLAEAHKPHLLETSQFIGLVVQKALTGVDPLSTLGKPTAGPAEVLPLKGFNKEKDVDFSLRAEEAHVPTTAIKSPSKATKEIPGNLFGHEDLIRAYWKAKPKTKTEAAWKLLMTELTKLQDAHGDSVVRTQLEQAEANRWQGITLANYERFGLPRSNTHQQASTVDWAAVEAVGSMF